MGTVLGFVDDGELFSATENLLRAARRGKELADADPYRNVVDPFSALFDSAYQGMSTEDWVEQEKVRQVQKSLQNALGDFHQQVLGAMPGWESVPTGGVYDLVNHKDGTIAEVKNKYNTFNSNVATAVYDSMRNALDNGKFHQGYVVHIIPKSPQKVVEQYKSGRKRPVGHDDLLWIDGYTFYEIASGEDDALWKLYKAMPKVLANVLGVSAHSLSGSPEFEDLFERAFGKFK